MPVLPLCCAAFCKPCSTTLLPGTKLLWRSNASMLALPVLAGPLVGSLRRGAAAITVIGTHCSKTSSLWPEKASTIEACSVRMMDA